MTFQCHCICKELSNKQQARIMWYLIATKILTKEYALNINDSPQDH